MYDDMMMDLAARLLGSALAVQIANLDNVGSGELLFKVDGKPSLPIPLNNSADLFNLCAAIAILAATK